MSPAYVLTLSWALPWLVSPLRSPVQGGSSSGTDEIFLGSDWSSFPKFICTKRHTLKMGQSRGPCPHNGHTPVSIIRTDEAIRSKKPQETSIYQTRDTVQIQILSTYIV